MGFFDALQTAMESLARNKLRSFLTTLGVIIGVASVIVMVALGHGAEEAVRSQFRGLGSNELTVVQPIRVGVEGSVRPARPITFEEARGLKDLPSIASVKVSLAGGGKVVRGRESLDSVSILGVPADWNIDQDPNYVAVGEFFGEYDVEDRARVAVVGKTVAEHLLPGENPVGQEIRINRLRFLVIGVIRELGRPDPRVDPNNQVLIPITTATADLFGKDRSVSVRVQVRNEREIDAVTEAIESYFREAHDIPPDRQVDVEVFGAREVTRAQQEAAATFALLLVGMAVVSLIVGGIGIMNVMLVSVTERTREVGVRVAVGARQRDIVVQFLIEAVSLSLSGGLLGVAAGILSIPSLTSYKPGLAAVLTWQSIPQASIVALLVGIVFGLYPAVRASRLDPVDALRYE
ncbi:MAG: ABC transporter permease [Chloroflexi bacterium]|nr:ABC transporter permease [Chloroflexota bacterium]